MRSPPKKTHEQDEECKRLPDEYTLSKDRVECSLQGKRGSLTTFGASATTASTFRKPKKVKKKKRKPD